MSVITPNPKTAGVARWNFLALWGHKQKQGDDAQLAYCTKVSLLAVCMPFGWYNTVQMVQDSIGLYWSETLDCSSMYLAGPAEPVHRMS